MTPPPQRVHRRTATHHRSPRRRLIALLVVMVMAFAGVAVKLAYIQAVSARTYSAMGQSQRLRSVVLAGQRGSIVDRNGYELAVSVPAKTVWADPKAVIDPAAAARALAPVLKIAESRLVELLSTDSNFVYLARKVDDPAAKAVAALGIRGVDLVDEPRRYGLSGSLAAPVLGRVGVDDQGLSGIEWQYDKALTGRPGELVVEHDPRGRQIAAGLRQLRPAVSGGSVRLTIDRPMQFETERALSAEIQQSRAKGGIAIVMDPTSGEILAMANLVAQPGSPPRPSADNMAVTRVYEPGSVNKVVTIAGAIEDKTVDPARRVGVPDTLKVADAIFKDAEAHPVEAWNVNDILSQSSNVGTIMIAQRLGKARIDSYLRAFGLSQSTGLGFPGESRGLLPSPKDWTGTSIATVPIGQGVAVTALQMLSAYNTIANQGLYVAPRMVRSVTDGSGKEQPVPQSPPRRVVSEETARTVTQMLVSAVREGTGTAAQINAYTVAGKTGTARKPRPGGVGYAEGVYVASFVGFVPAEAPRLSAIVVLDEPTPYFGGLVSAPVFSTVGAFAVRHFQVPPG